MKKWTTSQRRARLALRHHLARPAPAVEGVAGDLVGLHSSDPASVYLSARARVKPFRVADMERALYDEQTLVRMHGMRRTMFVVPVDLAPVVQASCTLDLIEKERQRFIKMLESQEVVPEPETWMAKMEAEALEALKSRGPATTSELTKEVPDLSDKTITFGEGTKWAGTLNAGARILLLLAFQGRVVRGRPRGSWISSQYCWHLPSDAQPAPLDTSDARLDLVSRWLRTFGPGSETDLKWWTGWTMGQVRAVLSEMEVAEVDLETGTGYALGDDLEADDPPPQWVALLPGLDSTSMGWKERDWYLGEHQANLFDRNGNAGPTVWLDGRIVGGWGQQQNRRVVFRLLEKVDSEAQGRIEAEAERLTEWLGDVRVTPRFRTPLEKELATS